MKCNKCWSIAGLLALALLATIYKFVVQGSIEPGADGRTAIRLAATERDLVLTEMRTFLESVQQITEGISKDDMQLVAKAAHAVGAATQQAVPGSLIGKLPIAFKQLGFDTHSKFDQLALDAEQLGDKDYALTQLTSLMHNCVACHTTYRFTLENGKTN